MDRLDRWLKHLTFIMLCLFAIVMPIVTYSNWHNQQVFQGGEKLATTAIIEVDSHNLKVYRFPENKSVVSAKYSEYDEGETLTLYYLEDNPDMVSESRNHYVPQKDIIIFFSLSVVCILLVVWQIGKRIKKS